MTHETAVVALPRESLAQIAPNYEAMRQAIVMCERVDEIAQLADVAVAAQAYYRQSRDVENEIASSRIRTRAERRLGELLKRMKESGERATGGKPSRDARVSTLADLNIPYDRASRAMQLSEVPEEEFEAALEGPGTAQPRKILREVKENRDVTPEPAVPIEHTLDMWGDVRDMGEKIEAGSFPPLALWRTNIQRFQIAEMRKYIPVIIGYLSVIHQEIERESV